MRNQVWSKDELILTLELYSNLKGRIPDVRHPEVAALASELAELAMIDAGSEARPGRSKAAIIFKMSNFRALDPKAKAKGKLGFRKGGAEDRKVWKEFANDPKTLLLTAEEIRDKIRKGQKELEPLKANLHILRLLGDELIGSQRLAVFELVKNAYDADAELVTVRLDLESNEPLITIKDNGCGMSLDTIRDGWLQIGTPLKRAGKTSRTPIFGRMPLGEKGVGRLAAFKLGDRLEMVTREEGNSEYLLVMDLESILEGSSGDQSNSVEDVRVRVRQLMKPKTFSGKGDHGTFIKITKMRPDLEWTKRELRELQRLINSLSSPFGAIGEFKTLLEIPGHEKDIKSLPDIRGVLDHAIWEFRFELNSKGTFRWTFKFKPPPVFRGLKGRNLKSKEKGSEARLEKSPPEPEPDMPARPPRDKLYYNGKDLKGIGPIKGRFYVLDLRGAVLKHLGGSQAIKNILNMQGGARVYRDGIRVFNYGEPGDDWLELNIKRVNRPGKTLATNSFIAAIHLSLDKSTGLREKTNREGFDENETFKRFRGIIESLVDQLNLLRQPDRNSLDAILKGDPIKEDAPVRFRKSVDEILTIASKNKGIREQIAKPVERIRKEYETLQEVVASSGAGLNLAIVFHEVEREVRALAKGLKKGEKLKSLSMRAETLITILDGFGSLLRKASRKTMPISTLIKRAVQLSQGRFNAHKIVFSCPLLQEEEDDFKASGAFNFYLQVLMNLIDNAIYWVRKKAELEGPKYHRAIQIRMLPHWAAEGPSLAVLDNGPGFSISPDEAMRPYASTRPGGMGLGLFFARTAMDANGGDLLIPSSIDDLDIDTGLDGAAVVMRFRRTR
jgi:anti-sigma regulatory factor (Ser/Thr protein kinase)